MQFQPSARAAKGIGQEDIGTCIDSPAIELRDAIRVFFVPQFWGIARLQPHVKEGRARCAIGHQPIAGFQEGKRFDIIKFLVSHKLRHGPSAAMMQA